MFLKIPQAFKKNEWETPQIFSEVFYKSGAPHWIWTGTVWTGGTCLSRAEEGDSTPHLDDKIQIPDHQQLSTTYIFPFLDMHLVTSLNLEGAQHNLKPCNTAQRSTSPHVHLPCTSSSANPMDIALSSFLALKNCGKSRERSSFGEDGDVNYWHFDILFICMYI